MHEGHQRERCVVFKVGYFQEVNVFLNRHYGATHVVFVFVQITAMSRRDRLNRYMFWCCAEISQTYAEHKYLNGFLVHE